MALTVIEADGKAAFETAISAVALADVAGFSSETVRRNVFTPDEGQEEEENPTGSYAYQDIVVYRLLVDG